MEGREEGIAVKCRGGGRRGGDRSEVERREEGRERR